MHKLYIPHGMSVTPGKAEIISNNGVASPSPRLQALLAGRTIHNNNNNNTAATTANLDHPNSMQDMMFNGGVYLKLSFYY